MKKPGLTPNQWIAVIGLSMMGMAKLAYYSIISWPVVVFFLTAAVLAVFTLLIWLIIRGPK